MLKGSNDLNSLKVTHIKVSNQCMNKTYMWIFCKKKDIYVNYAIFIMNHAIFIEKTFFQNSLEL